jgi:Fe-S-cluster-containing dehydrogenase component
MDRRKFLKNAAATGGAVIAGSMIPGDAHASGHGHDPAEFDKNYAVLFDATKCIGCRTCELACNMTNDLDKPDIDFKDLRVLAEKRRTDETTHTVVNRFYPYGDDARMNHKPVYLKRQCMHCNTPACVSACIVAALIKTPEGPVYYDESACIGCRYCMIACPFQVPVYEFDEPLFPIVQKCTLCIHRIPDKLPACVEACPQEAMTFGRRGDLLKLGHGIIEKNQDIYESEIYGEHTAGGTSWLYLLPVSHVKLGLPDHSDVPAPQLSETIQHTVFKYFIPPVALYIFLFLMMFRSSRMDHKSNHEGEEE